MKVEIEINYLPNDDTWTSDEMEMTQVEFDELDLKLQDIDNMRNLSFKMDEDTVHFPPSVLRQSTITIIIKQD